MHRTPPKDAQTPSGATDSSGLNISVHVHGCLKGMCMCTGVNIHITDGYSEMSDVVTRKGGATEMRALFCVIDQHRACNISYCTSPTQPATVVEPPLHVHITNPFTMSTRTSFAP